MDQEGGVTADLEPLKVLSLDGGGIRGISSLLILETIMEKIREARNLKTVPRPCECFDLIGGTSTGGIIAIMLGRLRMTVEECILAYKKVAKQAFTPKRKPWRLLLPSASFSAKALESAIKSIVQEFCVETECVARRRGGLSTVESCPHSETAFRDIECTKTVVLAVTKDNVDASPTLFKTYDMSAAYKGCTIWEVARATSAATTFFKSIKVGRDKIEFIDAGLGCNNPSEVLIQESMRQFPNKSGLCLLNIGTGSGDVAALDGNWRSVLGALKKIATSADKVAANLESRYGGSGQYYRFNVERGLQDVTLSDWDKTSKISAHTHNYLTANRRTIGEFVDNFIKLRPVEQAYPTVPSPISSNVPASTSGRCQIDEPAYVWDEESDNDFSEGRSNTSSDRGDACYACGRRGHWAYECPRGPCRTCGKRGHYASSCIEQERCCYKCGIPGHLARNCKRRRYY